MFAISVAGTSWAHRMRVGPKMLALAFASIALFWVQNAVLLALALAGVIGLYATLGPNALRQGAGMLRPILWVVGIILAFHIFRAEYYAGLVICLRLLVLVALANFVTLTSRLVDMTELFLWLLSPLKRIGVNTAAIGLALGMVMRFTPVFMARAGQLTQSWRARGGKRVSWQIILPLFITVVDDADHVAESLRARGGVNKG
jgi:biotin transport system permease protein